MLGQEIKTFIEENGLKQKKVAIDAGMSQQQLNDICNERRKVDAIEYFNICEALSVGLDYFADRVKKKASV